MITRIWHGRTKAADADLYLQFLQEKGIQDYLNTPGIIEVRIGRNVEEEVAHFWTISTWKDMDSITAFAGDPVDKARYYPEDDNFLLEFEPTVLHYETFTPLDNGPDSIIPDSICTDCGTYFPNDKPIPEVCPVCTDDRQFVGPEGQTWTSQDKLRYKHNVLIKPIREGLYSLKMNPSFAIGQRAFLYCSDKGNLLWDCIPLLNEPTENFVRGKGGLLGIVFSHPHYYSQMNLWAETFDCPIYIHESDASWIMDPNPRIQLWKGDTLKLGDATLYNLGGHFPGSSVMQVPDVVNGNGEPTRTGDIEPGKSGVGSLLAGDTLYIAPSKDFVAVSYSYPNHIPLPGKIVKDIFEKLAAIPFDTIYGAFEYQSLEGNAKEVLKQSAQRYKEAYGW